MGGDEAVRQAHRMAVRAALDAGETYTQARGGGDKASITTGKFLVAIFEHDTARPERLNEQNKDSLYPAPHLHSHCVMANLTVADKARSIQTGELFRAQQLIKAVYQSEMKYHLRVAGYEVHEGKNGAAEIQGYTKEYLAAESLRSARIQGRLEELGLTGRRAEEIIAHQDRNEKLDLTAEEVRALHLARAKEFGDQPAKVVADARERKKRGFAIEKVVPQEAVTFAKRSLTERLAVFDHFALVSEALKYGRGHVRIQEVEADVAQRRAAAQGRGPELISVTHGRANAPGLQYTTREMVATEREVLQLTKEGRAMVDPIRDSATPESVRAKYQHLNKGLGLNSNQVAAVVGLLHSPDRITGLQGSAGTGKTTNTLVVVAEYAKAKGFEIVGLAPTGRARKELAEAGIPAQTLQRFLLKSSSSKKDASEEVAPRVLIVDESSLVSTQQFRDLLKWLALLFSALAIFPLLFGFVLFSFCRSIVNSSWSLAAFLGFYLLPFAVCAFVITRALTRLRRQLGSWKQSIDAYGASVKEVAEGYGQNTGPIASVFLTLLGMIEALVSAPAFLWRFLLFMKSPNFATLRPQNLRLLCVVLVAYRFAPVDSKVSITLTIAVMLGALGHVTSGLRVDKGVLLMLKLSDLAPSPAEMLTSGLVLAAGFGCLHLNVSLLYPPAYSKALDTFDSMYFSIVTFATVGYGDIYPVSREAKLCCMAEIASGILVLILSVNAALTVWIQKHQHSAGEK